MNQKDNSQHYVSNDTEFYRTLGSAHGVVSIERKKERLIGLDPMFRTAMKIQIKDIDDLLPVQLSEGDKTIQTELFSYGSHHVISRVEVMGTVVRVDKKDRKQSYAVDDGTGVVSCVIWNNNKDRDFPAGLPDSADLPPSLRQKLKELLDSQEEGYSLGDLILVKGKVKEFAGRREIDVYDHKKITNPEVEYERWLELPKLYELYKKDFVPPETVRRHLCGSPDDDGLDELALRDPILTHINRPDFSQDTFTEMEVLKWPAVASVLLANQEAQTLSGKEKIRLVRAALLALQKSTGCVCVLRDNEDTFEKITANGPLANHVLSIIRQACEEGRASEMGCHSKQLLSDLQDHPSYCGLPQKVLYHVLSVLEENGDVISSMAQRYLPVS